MKIYFQNYVTNEGIPSENSQKTSVIQALEIFTSLNDSTENFFGIIDDSEKTMQFLLEDQDKWLVEIPNLPSLVNDQKVATFYECIEIITKIFEENKVSILPGMIKVDIMNESLQDLI